MIQLFNIHSIKNSIYFIGYEYQFNLHFIYFMD